MSDTNRQPDTSNTSNLEAIAEMEPGLVTYGIGEQADFDYLRVQIKAFEELKKHYDALMPYNGNEWFFLMKYTQQKDRLVNAIERRYQDIVDIVAIAQDSLKRKFEGDNRARVVAQIVKAIGGLESRPQIIDRTDRINVLR